MPPPDSSAAYAATHELVATVTHLDARKADVPAPVVSGAHVRLTITLLAPLERPLGQFAHARGELVCSWLPRQSL